MDFGDDDDNTLPQDDLGLVNLEQSNLNVISNNVEKSIKNEEGNSTSFEAEEKPRRNRCSILHKSIQGKLEISIGPEHQAELPHKIEDTTLDEGRDQCVWHPSKMPTDAKEFDDFVKTLCHEAGFQPDQAMEIFLKYGSMQKVLDDLNKFKERHNKTKWTEEEKMNFNSLVKEQKKNFARISKLMPTVRSPKECVEMYYKLKTKSFLINFGMNGEGQSKTTQNDDWLTQLKANFPQTGAKITTMAAPVINASFLENRIKYRLDSLFGMENSLESGGHQRRGVMQLRSTAKIVKVKMEENNNNKK